MTTTNNTTAPKFNRNGVLLGWNNKPQVFFGGRLGAEDKTLATKVEQLRALGFNVKSGFSNDLGGAVIVKA